MSMNTQTHSIGMQGMSLLELLIAVGLSSLIVTVLWRVYFDFQHAHAKLEQLMTSAYDVQLVEMLFRDRIRRAGFTPCMPLNSLWSEPPLLTFIIKPNALTLNRMTTPIQRVQVQDDNMHLMFMLGAAPEVTQPLLIADCYHTELVKIKAVHAQQAQLAHPLQYHYIDPVYVGVWLSETFYIRDQPAPALMLKHQHAEVLTTEIKDFEVRDRIDQGMRLLEVTLHQQDGKQHQLFVKIRAA